MYGAFGRNINQIKAETGTNKRNRLFLNFCVAIAAQ